MAHYISKPYLFGKHNISFLTSIAEIFSGDLKKLTLPTWI